VDKSDATMPKYIVLMLECTYLPILLTAKKSKALNIDAANPATIPRMYFCTNKLICRGVGLRLGSTSKGFVMSIIDK